MAEGQVRSLAEAEATGPAPLGPFGACGAAFTALADLLLPPVCINCRDRTGGDGLLCGPCWAKIEFISPPFCARLGTPLPYDTGAASLSAAAIATPPVYDRARAVARHSGVMRDLIHGFKYRDRHESLPQFGRWLKTAGTELLADADLIVPVPLYRWRLWSRRFNQSAMLALAVGRLAAVPVDLGPLARVKRTASQVGLNPAERRRNVAGAFRVMGDRTRVRGKRIVVIDDVITTGATVEACARVLKRAGAARVDVLALARALEPSAL
jgi:ComF family protein